MKALLKKFKMSKMDFRVFIIFTFFILLSTMKYFNYILFGTRVNVDLYVAVAVLSTIAIALLICYLITHLPKVAPTVLGLVCSFSISRMFLLILIKVEYAPGETIIIPDRGLLFRIVEKRWSSEAGTLNPRSLDITKTFSVTRSEFCINTAYAGAPGGYVVYTVYITLTYNPNTFKLASYSGPVMRIESHNWGDAFTNFQARDTSISAKPSANGIDVTANYFFKITSDFRDTIDTVRDYYNVDFGSHGMTYNFNGDMDEQTVYSR